MVKYSRKNAKARREKNKTNRSQRIFSRTTPPRYKKRLLSRKEKTKEIAIITRKEQPTQAKFIYTEAKALSPKYVQGGMVSSSWVEAIEWDPKNKGVYMLTQTGYSYFFKVPFTIFEQWYYAHSKGTYFNYYIKDKYYYTRLTKGS